jgi:hypothetical protein
MKEGPKPSRASVLHEVIEEILIRKDGQIPTDIDGIDTFFDGIEDLVNALLLRWQREDSCRVPPGSPCSVHVRLTARSCR